MSWTVRYCTSGDTDLAETTVQNDTELRIWVAEIDAARGVRGSVFDANFNVEEQNLAGEWFRQWGTDYWWLSMTGKDES